MEARLVKSAADRVLEFLDARLTSAVELNVFGRSAMAMAFPGQPDFTRTVDVDIILFEGQAEALLDHSSFWGVVDQLNDAFAPEGIYMTHFFVESQIVIRPEWREHRIPLPRNYNYLQLFRPANEDLFLTKCMRHDPLDMEDAWFICRESTWTLPEIEKILKSARIPDIPEIREQFDLCRREILRRMTA